MVVGDAKQSIYRFRDADVRMFESFGPTLARRVSLTTNFRSRPELLAWINKVCEPVFAPSEITYEPLQSNPHFARREESQEAPVVAYEGDGQGATPENAAAWVRSQWAAWEGQTIALLLRRVRTAGAWLAAFRNAGIPVRVSSGGNFWEDPRLRELSAMVRAWFRPQDQKSAGIFFRAPWFRAISPKGSGFCALSDIDRWIDRTRQREQPLMDAFLTTAHPLAHAWSALASNGMLRPGQILEALLEIPGAEAQLGSTALWLWHRFEDQSYAGRPASQIIESLIRDLEETPRTQEPAPPTETGVLNVMTIHASKGLEFDRVLLIDFGDPPRAQPAPLLYWDRDLGAFLAGRDESLERRENDSTEQTFEQRERQESLHECRRLFYVALTRAKQQLILILPPRKRPIPETLAEAVQLDDWRSWIEKSSATIARVRGEFEELEILDLPSTQRSQFQTDWKKCETSLVVRTRPRHSVSEWQMLARCPRQYAFHIHRTFSGGTASDATAREKSTDVEGASGVSRESAQEFGTAMHAMIQYRDRARADAIVERWGTEMADPHAVLDWIDASSLWDESQRVEKAWNELFFEVPVVYSPGSRCVLVGGIDRVVKFRSGDAEFSEYLILDFKLSHAGPEQLLDRYASAMRLYEYGLARMLGTPHSIRSALMAISKNKVEIHDLPRMDVETRDRGAETMAAQAHEILQQTFQTQGDVERAGISATPGPACRTCAWNSSCSASALRA